MSTVTIKIVTTIDGELAAEETEAQPNFFACVKRCAALKVSLAADGYMVIPSSKVNFSAYLEVRLADGPYNEMIEVVAEYDTKETRTAKPDRATWAHADRLNAERLRRF